MPGQNKLEKKSEFIETPPGNLFLRILFHSIHFQINKRLTGGERKDLIRTFLFLSILVIFTLGAVVVTPADPLLVFLYDAYERPSIVYTLDKEGAYIPSAEFYNFSRKIIKLDGREKLDSRIVRSFIATEDNNFFGHFGVDPRGILRAAFVNLLAGRIKEGASTITQQAVRLRFLSSRRSMFRKVREAYLSLWMELRYKKQEILEIYFNEVPLGHGTLGVNAASHFYFGKDVFDLSWGEAALIASLTTRPRDFSPLRNVQESRSKVRVVFKKLIENGELDISTAVKNYEDLENDYYSVLNRSPNESAFSIRLNSHPYVTEYVRYLLPPEYRSKLETGGLRIYTTVVDQHQTAAEEIFEPFLKELSSQRKRPPFRNFDQFDENYGLPVNLILELFGNGTIRTGLTREERTFRREFSTQLKDSALMLSLTAGERNIFSAFSNVRDSASAVVEEDLPVEGSMVSIRPNTGEITAVIGGSGFSPSNQQLRFISSRRQPGSSFKPILYSAGFELTARNPGTSRPLTPATIIDDSPVQFISQDLSEYSPENYSGGYEGPIRLRRGLALSKNSVAVRTYEYLGSAAVNPVIDEILNLNDSGRKVPREATIALGSFALTSMEMARTYAMMASGGMSVEPGIISYVTDASGKILLDFRKNFKPQKRVLSDQTAALISDMMKDVVDSGTGQGARLPGRAAAGKTGTTDRNTDAWFVGYTGNLVTSIHIGYDVVRSLGSHSTGGSIAAPIWGKYMHRALRGEKSLPLPASSLLSSVEICDLTGKLPASGCHTIIEHFIRGSEPKEVCDIHGSVKSQGIQLKRKKEDIFSDSDY